MTYDTVIETLRPLLAAEVRAELPGAAEPRDLEQAVWVRLLEHLAALGPPADPAAWLTATVRAEASRQAGPALRELPYATEPADRTAGSDPAHHTLDRERDRALHAAIRRLPGRC